MSEIVTRTLTGAVYVALTLGAAWAGQWTSLLLFLPVCAIAAREWHRLAWADDAEGPSEVITIALASTIYVAVALLAIIPQWSIMHATAVALGAMALLCFGMMIRGSTRPAGVLGMHAATMLYVALPFGLVTHFLESGPQPFIGFMLMLWSNDTGAYLAGRAFGRTKLMPSVSPKKTVEGSIGGVALTLAMAWWLSRISPVFPMSEWMICALVVAVMSTVGDLFESALKRARGVKDSGHVLPGHGGILDRFDSFLFAAPAMLLVIRLMG